MTTHFESLLEELFRELRAGESDKEHGRGQVGTSERMLPTPDDSAKIKVRSVLASRVARLERCRLKANSEATTEFYAGRTHRLEGQIELGSGRYPLVLIRDENGIRADWNGPGVVLAATPHAEHQGGYQYVEASGFCRVSVQRVQSDEDQSETKTSSRYSLAAAGGRSSEWQLIASGASRVADTTLGVCAYQLPSGGVEAAIIYDCRIQTGLPELVVDLNARFGKDAAEYHQPFLLASGDDLEQQFKRDLIGLTDLDPKSSCFGSCFFGTTPELRQASELNVVVRSRDLHDGGDEPPTAVHYEVLMDPIADVDSQLSQDDRGGSWSKEPIDVIEAMEALRPQLMAIGNHRMRKYPAIDADDLYQEAMVNILRIRHRFLSMSSEDLAIYLRTYVKRRAIYWVRFFEAAKRGGNGKRSDSQSEATTGCNPEAGSHSRATSSQPISLSSSSGDKTCDLADPRMLPPDAEASYQELLDLLSQELTELEWDYWVDKCIMGSTNGEIAERYEIEGHMLVNKKGERVRATESRLKDFARKIRQKLETVLQTFRDDSDRNHPPAQDDQRSR